MAIFRCRITGTFTGGDVWSTSLHAFSNSATSASVLSAWNTFCGSVFNTTLKPLWAPVIKSDTLIVDMLDETTGKATEQSRQTLAITGTAATPKQSSQRSSLVIGLRTSLPTKAGRGRMYTPGLDAASFDADGNVLQATQTSIANAVGAALIAMKSTAQPVVYHRPVWNRDLVPPQLITAGSHHDIKTVTVGKVEGTQRRRSNKVPQNYQSANA